MADRGGLNYRIVVEDDFSKATTRFREDVEASSRAFRELKKEMGSGRSNASAELEASARAQRKNTSEARKAVTTQERLKKQVQATAIARSVDLEAARQNVNLSKKSNSQLSIEKQARDDLAKSLRKARVEKQKLNQANKDTRKELNQLQEEVIVRNKVAQAQRKQRVQARLLELQRKTGLDLGVRENRVLSEQEAALRRVTKARRDQRIAQAEISIRRAQGLPIDPALVRKASGEVRELNKQVGFLRSGLGGVLPSIQRIVTAFLLFRAVRSVLQTFRKLVSESLLFNSVLERSQLSIAGLVVAAADVRDIFGQGSDTASAFSQSLAIARQQTQKLRVDALRTTATFKELLEALQVSIAPGLSAGLDVDEIRKVTVLISQAATSLGVAQGQLAEEIRSVLTGAINVRTSRIATALGITNKDIKAAKQAGTLFTFLTGRLDAFNISATKVAQSFEGLTRRINDAFQAIAGASGEEFFTRTRDLLREILDILIVDGQPNQTVVDILLPVFEALSNVVDTLSTKLRNLDFQKLNDTLSSFGRGAEAALTTLLNVIIGISEGISLLSDLFSSFFTTLNSGDGTVTQSLAKWSTFLLGIAATAKVVSLIFGGIGFVVKPVAAALKTGVLNLRLWLALTGGIGSAMTSIGAGAAKAAAALKAIATSLATGILLSLGFVLVAFNKIVNKIEGTNLSIRETTVLLGKTLLGVLVTLTRFVVQNFFRAVITVFDALIGAAELVNELFGLEIVEDGIQKLTILRESIRGVHNEIQDILGTQFDNLRSEMLRTIRLAQREAQQMADGTGFFDPSQTESLADFADSISPALSSVRQGVRDVNEELAKLDIESEDLDLKFAATGAGGDALDSQIAKLKAQKQLQEELERNSNLRLQAQKQLAGVQAKAANLTGTDVFFAQELLKAQVERLQVEQALAAQREAASAAALEEKDALETGQLLQANAARNAKEVADAQVKQLEAQLAADDARREGLAVSKSVRGVAEDLLEAQGIVNSLRTDELQIVSALRGLISAIARDEAKAAAIRAKGGASERTRELTVLRAQLALQQQLSDERLTVAQREDIERTGAIQARQVELAQERELVVRKRDQLVAQQRATGLNQEQSDALASQLADIEERLLLTDQIGEAELERLRREQAAARNLLDVEQARADLSLKGGAERDLKLLAGRLQAEEQLAGVVGRSEAALAARSQAELTLSRARADATLEQRRAAIDLLETQLELASIQGSDGDVATLQKELTLRREALAVEDKLLDLQIARSSTQAVVQARQAEIAQLRQREQLDLLQAQVTAEQQLSVAAGSRFAEEAARARANLRTARLRNEATRDRLVLERQSLQTQAGFALLAGRGALVDELDAQVGALNEQISAYEHLAALQEQSLAREVARTAALSDGSFLDGALLGVDDFIRKFESIAQTGRNIVTDSLDAVTDAVKGALIALTKEDTAAALEAVALQLANSLLDSLLDNLINYTTSKLLDGLLGGSVDDLLGAQGAAQIQVAAATESAVILTGAATAMQVSMVAGATTAAAILSASSFGRFGASPLFAKGGFAGNLKGGAHRAASVQGFAHGGPVKNKPTRFRPKGLDPRDKIAAFLRKDEYVLRPEAVSRAGLNFVEGLNRGLFSPAALQGLASGIGPLKVTTPDLGFATGGLATTASAASPGSLTSGSVGFGSDRDGAVFAPVMSQKQFERISSGGSEPFLKIVSKNKSAMRGILGIK